MNRRRAVSLIMTVILIWAGLFAADFIAVSSLDRVPLFCVEDKAGGHFTGLGYSYDAYANPVTGKFEYCLYIFGIQTKSTFTNEIAAENQ